MSPDLPRTGTRGRTAFALSSLAVTVVGAGFAAGCGPDGRSTVPNPVPSLTTSSSASQAATPSISREVPQDQRRELPALGAADLCAAVTPEDLAQLAYPVQPGQPAETPPAKGCTFHAASGMRSLLVAAQPEGYGDIGRDEIELGDLRGSQTAHANDCTVYAPVRGGTLQVSAKAAEADSNQCEQAQEVAQFVLPGLAR